MRWCRGQKPEKCLASIVPVASGCHPAVRGINANRTSWLLQEKASVGVDDGVLDSAAMMPQRAAHHAARRNPLRRSTA
jgi:hypothetical protein